MAIAWIAGFALVRAAGTQGQHNDRPAAAGSGPRMTAVSGSISRSRPVSIRLSLPILPSAWADVAHVVLGVCGVRPVANGAPSAGSEPAHKNNRADHHDDEAREHAEFSHCRVEQRRVLRRPVFRPGDMRCFK
jgi:hypothetical protein